MATGVPKTTGRKTVEAVRLEYPGKKPVEEILQTPPVTLVQMGEKHPHDNRLIFAENLGALAALAQDKNLFGQVRLVYIDPPFATHSTFHSRKLNHAYEDTLVGAEFIEFLRERLVWLHQLLAVDGSLYLHLDERMVFYFRVILDEIFGPRNYRNCITRKKCNPKNYTRNNYGNITDYVLFYTKSDDYVWNRALEPWTDERVAKEYQYVERKTGRRYKKVPVHAPEVRHGETGKAWRGMLPPPGKHWQYPPAKLDELDAKGEIYWSPRGNPRRKVYLAQSPGVPLQDIWLDLKDAHNQKIPITGYPTEKNPALLRRIILASSHPDDLVLDVFSVSGTTLAAASELRRRWIGVDNSPEAIRTTLKRFAVGLEPMGDYVIDRVMTPAMLPLFAETAEKLEMPAMLPLFEDTTAKSVEGHVTIADFTLYAEVGFVEELQLLLSQRTAPRILVQNP